MCEGIQQNAKGKIMAYFKKKICSKAGCTSYATNGAFCEEHTPKGNRDTTSKFAPFYHRTWWKRERKNFLIRPENTWCVECLKENKHTLSDTVHHEFGFSSYNEFCDKRHWVGICSSCHSRLHQQVNNEELYAKHKGEW